MGLIARSGCFFGIDSNILLQSGFAKHNNGCLHRQSWQIWQIWQCQWIHRIHGPSIGNSGALRLWAFCCGGRVFAHVDLWLGWCLGVMACVFSVGALIPGAQALATKGTGTIWSSRQGSHGSHGSQGSQGSQASHGSQPTQRPARNPSDHHLQQLHINDCENLGRKKEEKI